MNKLTKAQIADMDKHAEALDDASNVLAAAVEKYNGILNTAWMEVEAAVVKYNETVQDADAWRNDIASEISEHYDEKSEKWQEGEAGCAHDEWAQAWGESLDEIELDEPDELDPPDTHTLDSFTGAYPTERAS